MNGSWRVEVAEAAEAAIRELSRSAARRVAAALDLVARSGPAALTDLEGDPAGTWMGRRGAGDFELTFAGREDRTAVLVRIDTTEREAPAALADALPLTPPRRRDLARWLQGLAMDLRYTARALRRSPVFALAVVATLALGIGGAASLLGVVGSVHRGALPFRDGDELVRIRNESIATDGGVRRYNITPADFHLIRDQNRTFTGVVAMAAESRSLVGDGPAERVRVVGVSPGWAAVLGLQPALGRVFTAGEEQAGRGVGVALISHALWLRRFGGDSAAIGRDLRYDGGSLRVIGVMPRRIRYPYEADVWIPGDFPRSDVVASSLNVVARLAPGTTLEAAAVDLTRLHAVRLEDGIQTAATGVHVVSVRTDMIREDARILDALAAAVALLLLLACVNVANLLVGRFAARQGEIGVRAALGAGRARQVRQLCLEAAALFVLGGVGGVVLSVTLGDLLTVFVPDNLKSELGVAGDGPGALAALLALGTSLVGGIVVGGLAAFRSGRADLTTLVKGGSRVTTGRGDRRLIDGLVVAQLALSLVLLVGAGALIDHFRRLSGADSGYRLDGVVTMNLTLEQDRFADGERRLAVVRAVEAAVRAAPGVVSVGITTVNPFCCGDWGAPVETEDRPLNPGDPPPLVAHSYVTPSYFETVGIGLRRGVPYSDADRPGGDLTVVIDEAFARQFWPGADALGRRVRLARPGQPWRTVTGIVPVVEHDAEMSAAWYLPYFQDPLGGSTTNIHLMVRGSGAVDAEAIRRVIAGVDPDLAAFGLATMPALRAARFSQDRLGAIVSVVFAVFGLILAGFSLYGLLSYSVEVRTPEIGTRIALGATRGRILRLVLGQAGRRLGAGLVVGLAAALGLNRLLRHLVEGVEWVPFPLLGLLVAVLAAIAIGAAYLPARRATLVDPVRSIKA